MIPIIDMHCDTISVIHNQEVKGEAPYSLRSNSLQINLQNMKKAAYMCQNLAMFTYLGSWMDQDSKYGDKRLSEAYPSPYDYCMAMSEVFDREVAANSDLIRPVLTAEDIEKNFREGYMSALKTIEEGAVYEGSVDKLKAFYEKGVRMTTLTWNFENELGFPNRINMQTGRTEPDTENGLKPAGKDLAEACMELGIILDVSHLNDAGIYDIIDMTKGKRPFVASHSNARSLTGHSRNLTDDMLRKLAEGGGVTGINFCSDFLNDRHDKMASIEDMIRHIRYIENIAGIDAIGLGTDFDGIGNEIEFGGCGGMQRLAEGLEKAGYSQDKIEKIFYKNVLRVYREVL